MVMEQRPTDTEMRNAREKKRENSIRSESVKGASQVLVKLQLAEDKSEGLLSRRTFR
jgi:hypothetical protein